MALIGIFSVLSNKLSAINVCLMIFNHLLTSGYASKYTDFIETNQFSRNLINFKNLLCLSNQFQVCWQYFVLIKTYCVIINFRKFFLIFTIQLAS